MTGGFQVKCRASAYDEEHEMLVLVCFFEDFGESRVVYFPRSDFHYKVPGNSVPHQEMRKTAAMFKGQRFRLVIEDDPDRSREAEENPVALHKEFVKEMEEQLGEVYEGLTDSNKVLARRLGEVIERDQKEKFGDLLANEMSLRSRLKDINFED
jgi:hypothetical protein